MAYVAFSDESNNDGRYRSICAFSFPADQLHPATSVLGEIVAKSGLSEFKWAKLKSAKYRFCALQLLDSAIDNCRRGRWRLDVIVWDTQDARHTVKNRDDRKNFERMFFHLLKNAMCRRELDAMWQLFPDERLDIDWPTVQDCLQNVGKWKKHFEHPLLKEEFSEHFYRLEGLEPIHSHLEPACQLADLFAGLGAFSRTKAREYGEWRCAKDPQQNFFATTQEPTISHRERERFTVLDHFIKTCRSLTLGVSIKTRGYLMTWDPDNPINFWHYEPQHASDQAPTKD